MEGQGRGRRSSHCVPRAGGMRIVFVLKGPIPSLNKLRQDQETKSDNP